MGKADLRSSDFIIRPMRSQGNGSEKAHDIEVSFGMVVLTKGKRRKRLEASHSPQSQEYK